MPAVLHKAWQPQFLAPSPVYLDSSVTVAWLTSTDRLNPRAVQFVGEHLRAGVELQVSLLTVDETIWRLVRRQIASVLGLPARRVNAGVTLKNNPRMLASLLPVLRPAVASLIGVTSLVDGRSGSPRMILDSWLDRWNDISGVNDALHLSFAQFSGSKSLVTGDNDFATIGSLPMPLQIVQI